MMSPGLFQQLWISPECAQQRREAQAKQQMLALQSLVAGPGALSDLEQLPFGKRVSEVAGGPLADGPDVARLMPRNTCPVGSGAAAAAPAFERHMSGGQVRRFASYSIYRVAAMAPTIQPSTSSYTSK